MLVFIYNNGLIINGGQKDIRIVKFHIFYLRSKWYKIYSDQWIEQGGYSEGMADKTISILKEHANTDFSSTFTTYKNGNTAGVVWILVNITTSSLKVLYYRTSSGYTCDGVYWTTTGY